MKKMFLISLVLAITLATVPAFAASTLSITASGAKVSASASVSGTGSASASGHALGFAASNNYGAITISCVQGGANAASSFVGSSAGASFTGCAFGVVVKPGFASID